MINEQTSYLLQDHTIKNEILKKKAGLCRHPYFQEVKESIENLPDQQVSGDEFHAIVENSPGLEKIIRTIGRPALFISKNSFEVPISDKWNAKLNASRNLIEKAIQAVGRIELKEPRSNGYLGTGWLIADNVVVTNRHVAMEFARLDGQGQVIFRHNQVAGGRKFIPAIDFREEFGQTIAPLELTVSNILYLAPDDNDVPDIALLKIESAAGLGIAPIPLSDTAVKSGQAIVAIGYPGFDRDELDRATMLEIFQSRFNVKRLSPGEVMVPPVGNDWFFTHDCSTLAGNSGSVILDIDTGTAVGLHYSGVSGEANYAVSIKAVKTVLESVLEDTPSPAAPALPQNRVIIPEAVPFSVQSFQDRDGYDAEFLKDGIIVPMPKVIPERAHEIAKRTDIDSAVLTYRHFSVVMNKQRRFPMITAVNINGNSLRRIPGSGSWRTDQRIAAEAQADNSIYSDNNLDRGHMVRRLDPVWGTLEEATQANTDTFHYTNACPQDHTFNDEVWGDLEDYILDSAPHDNRLSVLTGPVLDSDDPEYRGINIPRSFWKVVAWRDGNQLKTAGFILAQDEFIGNLEFNPFQFSTYQITLKEIGEKAGLDFGQLIDKDVFAGGESAVSKTPIKTVEEIRL